MVALILLLQLTDFDCLDVLFDSKLSTHVGGDAVVKDATAKLLALMLQLDLTLQSYIVEALRPVRVAFVAVVADNRVIHEVLELALYSTA
jgi:hypothetical protein